MDVIRDSIENRADDVCRAQEELRTAPSTPILPPMRPSMGRWHNTTVHIRQTAPAKKPLNRPSAPTMQRTGWIRRRRSKMCWKSSGRNGYSSFLPTPSSTRTMTGVSLRTIKPGQNHSHAGGQRCFPPLCLSGCGWGQPRSDRPVYQAGQKNHAGTAEKFLSCKSSGRNRLPASLPPPKNGSRSDNHGKAQAGCSGFVLGVRRRTGTDPSKDAAIWDKEFERLSAEKWRWMVMWSSWNCRS